MPSDQFHASDVTWQGEARCSGAGFDFVPYSESVQALEAARALYCNVCPVRAECLAYALLYHLSGFWGGTSTAERRRLAVPRNRAKCPSCRSRAVIHVNRHEICQHCGMSWTGSRQLGPEGEAAV